MDDADLPALVGAAMAWRDADPDPRTRRELDLLIERCTGADDRERDGVLEDLANRFDGTLTFGTAGLRGALGAGPNRMNRAVVIRAAAGLAAFLTDRLADLAGTADTADGGKPRVVVGYDARRDSDVFARDTCAVLEAAGCTALLLPGLLPTPVLAFAVRHLAADAGVMVTASHNPPQDNGYKVYLGGRIDGGDGQGAQIVPPSDREISERIEDAPSAIDVPMATGGWQEVPVSIVDDYLAAVVRVLDLDAPRNLDIVITPLHGVGGNTVVRAFSLAGFPVPHLVPEQAEPDGTFPTVSFPNPEEAGALDLALASARSRGADLVIANDPDADRCAVAVPTGASGSGSSGGSGGSGSTGGWRMLRGDEVGSLLGEYLLSRDAHGSPRTVASTIVSSQLLSRIAAAHGDKHVLTLTGFKWLTRVPGVDYAYEEALGYSVAPRIVRDKDGISAALLVAELAARLKARGRTLQDALDDLARQHGLHATAQLSVRVDDLAEIEAMMTRLTATTPTDLAGLRVVSAQDLGAGFQGLPPTPGMCLSTEGGGRVIVRPSGTEAKLKCYLEVVVPVDDVMATAQQRAATALAALRTGIMAALGVSAEAVS